MRKRCWSLQRNFSTAIMSLNKYLNTSRPPGVEEVWKWSRNVICRLSVGIPSWVCHQPAADLSWGEKSLNCAGWIFSSLRWVDSIYEVPSRSPNVCVCETRSNLLRTSRRRAIIRNGFTKTGGKSPGILDIPPHPPAPQCRKSSPLSPADSMEPFP